MVLHLLGKKSWNVYNTANVARVRRDEAEAHAREQAEEQRMQDEDAARRIAVLKGHHSPARLTSATPPPESAITNRPQHHHHVSRPHGDASHARPCKRRRLRGEDDTDRDIRAANATTEAGEQTALTLLTHKQRDAALQDDTGHVQLFPAPDEPARRKAEKNADVEADKAKKRRRDEDQYTMRFSNAAGSSNPLSKPWYAGKHETSTPASTDVVLAAVQGKDVWGNEDPRRREREQKRITSSDPFAAMQSAQRQLKQSARDREAFKQQQRAQIEDLNREAQDRKRRDSRRRTRDVDVDSLEGFRLDVPADTHRTRTDDGRDRNHRHHHRHRHRDRNPSRARSQRHRQQERERAS